MILFEVYDRLFVCIFVCIFFCTFVYIFVFVGVQLLVQDMASAESQGPTDDCQTAEGVTGAWVGVCGHQRPRMSTGSTSVSDTASSTAEMDTERRQSFIHESMDEPCGKVTKPLVRFTHIPFTRCLKLSHLNYTKWLHDI